MADYSPQSTDRTSGDTNPLAPKVLLQGSTTVAMTAVSGGNRGTAEVNLPIDANLSLLKPEAMALAWNLGGGVTRYYPLPFVEINDAAAIRRMGELYIEIDAKPLAYTLMIDLFDASTSQSITVRYRIMTLGL